MIPSSRETGESKTRQQKRPVRTKENKFIIFIFFDEDQCPHWKEGEKLFIDRKKIAAKSSFFLRDCRYFPEQGKIAVEVKKLLLFLFQG